MAANSAESQDPPLVDVKVTNPVTYFKKWWNKIIGNEGMEFRFKVKPLTAIAISLVVVTVAFGLGQVDPALITEPSSTPIPEVWKETAFTGILQFSETTGKFYLVTSSSAEAISLEVPEGLVLEGLIGKRILAAGEYNKPQRILKVAEAKDMEVLPKKPVPIPTFSPTPAPTQEATSSAAI